MFKMHGSVDWQRTKAADGSPVYGLGHTKDQNAPDPEFALNCPGPEIGIATPGPSKAISTKELRLLRHGAPEKIREAEIIILVGYRFPPSDAEARERLLGALRENKNPRLDLYTGLGPRQQADDVVRLAQMLKAVRRTVKGENPMRDVTLGYWVQPHALYAEDFCTVWSRELLRPYDHREHQ